MPSTTYSLFSLPFFFAQLGYSIEGLGAYLLYKELRVLGLPKLLVMKLEDVYTTVVCYTLVPKSILKF
ncbi:unnamed protein product [Cuscuta campestris]|uniref:Uncharacterized protein n=1 Tax=Cuscuta campestris TaxID=132261 RepID=A0A484KKJ2_9ASTE|nr:unnamed protein product [Cuscuta campestris]